jgi:hypothetical protein
MITNTLLAVVVLLGPGVSAWNWPDNAVNRTCAIQPRFESCQPDLIVDTCCSPVDGLVSRRQSSSYFIGVGSERGLIYLGPHYSVLEYGMSDPLRSKIMSCWGYNARLWSWKLGLIRNSIQDLRIRGQYIRKNHGRFMASGLICVTVHSVSLFPVARLTCKSS